MMLTPILLCGLLVGPVQAPSALLEDFYADAYGCRPVPHALAPMPGMGESAGPARPSAGGEHLQPDGAQDEKPGQATVMPYDIGSFFPSAPAWWPLFTSGQVGGAEYRRMVDAGVKPGVLLPANPLQLLQPANYWRYRKAVKEGAIAVQSMQNDRHDDFAARASFAAALGLRPLAALVIDGWSDNLPAAGQGTYLIDHRTHSGYAGLPVPARDNRFESRHFYHANDRPPRGGGFGVVIDPPMSAIAANIAYPALGISWRYADADFHSSLNGLDTSPMGFLLATATLLSAPAGVFFAGHWPDILQLLGTSIAWFWLFAGGALLVVLILSGLRRLWRLQ